jgi:mono/diheme cytochrome c family protein
MIRRLLALWALVLLSAAMLFATADGAWLARVPAGDRQKTNPYEGKPDAIAAGRNIFEEHCSKCHGQNAEGVKKRPSLRSERIQRQATDGDLHWLLVNGSMKKGMPPWAKLPDPQLWQLITYLKSLHE